MIDRQKLLADLKPVLKELEQDLRARCGEMPQIDADLKKEYEQARAADRTGVTYEEWRADLITQVAVAWVLSCVFVRFLEDNALVTPPRISGPLHGTDAGLMRARDERETYFKTHAKQTDRDYLLAVFDDLAQLPGTKDVFGAHNPALAPAYRGWISGDGAQKLIEFFQKIQTDSTGEIIHDFTDPTWDTRFLGDLYQDLSEAARKKYALLQTPIFVEEFILERTLEPAIKEFGLDAPAIKDSSGNPITPPGFRMIDLACGSGHFLLGSFARILKHWRAKEPGTSDRELVNRTLAAVHGVDLNPYAIAIARFRLLLVAMRECHLTRLTDAPNFAFNLVCGDSLLHGKVMQQALMGFHELAHAYQSEDLPELQRILSPGIYHAVVANPPYITVKDKTLNQAYRDRYSEVCHMKYSLSVPFMQRLIDLTCQNGFTGQITSNSFMKREFGKKLIESYLPKTDVTYVIDTGGAYIPGHGTPTVILFGRQRQPVAQTIRAVMGIRGEPSTPDNPAHGLVWTAITKQIDQVGSQSDFVSVNNTPREQFSRHPWSIGGGGAAELKEQLDQTSRECLAKVVDDVGITAVTGEDDFYTSDQVGTWNRLSVENCVILVEGDQVRDWGIREATKAIWTYDPNLIVLSLEKMPNTSRLLWRWRSGVNRRKRFGTRMVEKGLQWYEWQEIYKEKLIATPFIAFSETATHNHFVLVKEWNVFKNSAPVIKLPANATEDEHFALVGLLNSSAACFWLKQVAHNKGSTVDEHGARQRTAPFEDFYAFNATKLEQFPLPPGYPLELARQIDTLARVYAKALPEAVCLRSVPDPATLACLREQAHCLSGQMIALQEELDWQCYRLYGLLGEDSDILSRVSGKLSGTSREDSRAPGEVSQTPGESSRTPGETSRPFWELSGAHGERSRDFVEVSRNSGNEPNNPVEPSGTPGTDDKDVGKASENAGIPSLALGQRAFEIVLARQLAAGEVESTWFTRHGSTPITEIPPHWPAEYRAVVQRRIDLIEKDKNIGLIEKPEYKRRWNTEPWDEQQDRALCAWLLDRLESFFDLDGRMNEQKKITAAGELQQPKLTSVAKLADLARQDREFMQVAELFAGRMDFDVGALVGELVAAESVPALPILRYKPAALDKRRAWERTWELQRKEDRLQAQIDALTAEWKQAEAESKPTATFSSQIDALKAQMPSIPVPPKYISADFLSGNVWRLRGKLDVPKERWVSFPNCEGEDGTLVIAWAGYNHLQLARAIAEGYELAKELEGRKLVPLLAAIGELIPWLKQWHNELDPQYGTHMGDYFEKYLAEEAKAIGQSVEQVMAWTPPAKVKKAARKKQVIT